MKFDIKHILIFGLALGMTSCVETMKDGDMSTGFLGVPVLDADIQVEEFGATKAAPPDLPDPKTLDLHFKVTGSDSKLVWNQVGLWSTPLKMPVGEYTIEVNYGSNTYGDPWYTGTCNGTISAVTEAVPAIGLRLFNSLLAVDLANDLTPHFTPSEENEGKCVTISSTSGYITTTLGKYVFVPAGEALTIQVAGTSSTGESKILSRTLKNPLSAATATYVTCSLTTTDAPKIKLEGTPEAWGTVGYIPVATTENISKANVDKMVYIAEASDNPSSKIQGTVKGTNVAFEGLTPGTEYSVYATIGALQSNKVDLIVATISTEANHTKNSSLELDGTDFTALINIPEKFKEVVANVNLTLSDGNKVRREKTLKASEIEWNSDGFIEWNSYGSEETSWPYLPKGSYTLKGTVSYKNGTKNAYFTKFEVSAPRFTVNTPSAHTSYNTYLTSGAAAANNEDGSTIYGIANNGVKISNDILTNDNYKSLIGGYTYFIDKEKVDEGNNANQSWGAHDIVAKYTFDGVTAASDPLTCHVTGLPYKIDFKSSIDRWELNKAEKVSGGLKMNPYTSTATLTFHLPSTISTLVTIFQGSTLYGTRSYIWLNLTIGSTKTEKFLKQSEPGLTHTETINTDKSISGTLSANNNSVILENPSTIASYNVVVPGLSIVYN